MSRLLTQQEACEYLNISRTTILRWEKEGRIYPLRTAGKHRRYPIEELDRSLANEQVKSESKNCLIYARESTKKHRDSSNLEGQINRLVEHAIRNKYNIVDVYKEVGSGINENRNELKKLLERLQEEDIRYLLIENKDRLARFGFSYIERYCNSHNVEIVILVNQEEEGLNKEMIEDMISIITSFSDRIYGKIGAAKIQEILDSLEIVGEKDEINS